MLFVVNNSRAEAACASQPFLQNQAVIFWLQSLVSSAASLPEDLRELSSRLQTAGLGFQVLDLSSLDFAEEDNNVGIARDIGGRYLAAMFARQPAGDRGIIAFLDADTAVSAGYLAGLMEAFAQRRLNGAAGQLALELEIDDMPPEGKRLFSAAAQRYFGRPALWAAELNFQPRMYLKNNVSGGRQVLVSGQNMAVSAGAFCRAGGYCRWHLWEDFLFGQRIEKLTGEVALCSHYGVITLARVSDRTGFHGLGRALSSIRTAVNDYLAGRAAAVLLPDNQLFTDVASRMLHRSLTENRPTSEMLSILEEFGFADQTQRISLARAITAGLKRDFAVPPGRRTFSNYNRAVLAFLLPATPLVAMSV